MNDRPFTWSRLLVEVVLLSILGIILDTVGRSMGINTGSGSWFITKLVLFMAALFTFLPPIVNKILDFVDSLRK